MRQVHCDGCGFTEPDDLSKSKRTIAPITLMQVKDHRFPASTEKFEADLCQNCLGMLKHTYFKVPAEGQLELPAFLGPRMREPDPGPLLGRRAQ